MKPPLYPGVYGTPPPPPPSSPVNSTADLENAHTILDAAKDGAWCVVWDMLDNVPDLINSFPAPRRFTLLHHAISQLNISALEKLIDKNVAKSTHTRDGISPRELIDHLTCSDITKKAMKELLHTTGIETTEKKDWTIPRLRRVFK